MTNNQFWSKLDTVAKKKPTPNTIAEFATLLIQGYNENLELIISCIDDATHPGYAFQSYVNTEFGRLMLCYTSNAHADKEKRKLPGDDNRIVSSATASCRSILDNMLNKSVIAGLAFNSDCFNSYIIPKELLQIAMFNRI